MCPLGHLEGYIGKFGASFGCEAWQEIEKRCIDSHQVTTDTIRLSTEVDLQAIRQWLEQEDAEGVYDNFLCNWEIIHECHQKGRLTVYVDGASGLPVAFQLGGLLAPGILQVRNDLRRRGIGKKLVAHFIEEALKKDECVLHIECNPPSSIPFWLSMGFILYDGPTPKKRAYRVLRKEHHFPKGGKQVDVAIRFFPEDRKWSGGEAIRAYDAAVPTAMQYHDGTIYLSERVSVFKGLDQEGRDVVVEIALNGRRLYLDKAKYPEARQLGVRRCSNGFYIDCVHISSTAWEQR